jgi:hypothetical protein
MNSTLRVLELSTAHMPSSDALEEIKPITSCATNEYGGFVWVGQEELSSLPAWLRPICRWAKAGKAEWVRFDCDAPVVDKLPKFDWENPVTVRETQIYEVDIEAWVPIGAHVYVSATSQEEAESNTQADIDRHGWGSDAWQNSSDWEVSYDAAERLCVKFTTKKT